MGSCLSTDGLLPASVKDLWVIVVHFNPVPYRRRSEVFTRTVTALVNEAKRLDKLGRERLHVVAVDLSYGPGQHETRSAAFQSAVDMSVAEFFDASGTVNPAQGKVLSIIELHTLTALWAKEGLINLAVRRLPSRAQALAWIDSDILFERSQWVKATIDELREHQFVQMWSDAVLLGPHEQELVTTKSFAYQLVSGKTYASLSNTDPEYWHPGFAWACTRAAFDKVGGLPDRTLGSADRHMAMALIGRVAETVPPGLAASYMSAVQRWERAVQGMTLGCVHGRIKHLWHGPLSSRQYMGRWEILIKHRFDPERHMRARDGDGLVELAPGTEALEADIMTYFRQRNEDSLELDTPQRLLEAQRSEAARITQRTGARMMPGSGSGSFGAGSSAAAAAAQMPRFGAHPRRQAGAVDGVALDQVSIDGTGSERPDDGMGIGSPVKENDSPGDGLGAGVGKDEERDGGLDVGRPDYDVGGPGPDLGGVSWGS